MKFKDWKIWITSQPQALRWFPYLVLIRPIIDSLFSLKNISPIISPPYIAGILTPFLCLLGIWKYKKNQLTKVDLLFNLLSILVSTSLFFLFIFEGTSFYFLQFLIKLSLPFFLYYFLRRFIRSEKDLDGVLQTFLYSAIYIAAIFLYEIVINPISVQESRGLTRIQGLFGDVLNYSIYVTFSLLAASHFFLKYQKTEQSKKHFIILIITIIFAIGIASNIHHSATWAVIISLLGFLFYNYVKSNRKTGFIIVIVAVPVIILLAKDIFIDKISPLIESDIAVLEGRKAEERLLHGRVGRWKVMWEDFSSQHMFAQFMGYPLSLKYCLYYIGTGAHNDYFRIMMLMGYSGLLIYIYVLLNSFKKAYNVALKYRYATTGALFSLVLLSVSVTPTIYAPFLYIILSIIAFLQLNK